MITRVESGIYGGRLTGSFAGKSGTGNHPVGELTRVTSGLWGARLAGSFAGKIEPAVIPQEEHRQFFANFDRSLMAEVDRKLRRRKEEEELVIILAVAVTKRLLH